MSAIAWSIVFASLILNTRDKADPNFIFNNAVDCTIAIIALVMMLICTVRNI